MDLVAEDVARGLQVPAWQQYQTIVYQAENKKIELERVERFSFYDRAKQSFAIIHTGDTAQYGNIILKKGIVPVS